jgi:exopolysaccharide biosynthesis protein
VITATDTDLDNAKSYVSVFTLGHVTQLRQLVDDDDPKTLSTWMGTVTGETLGWNSSAWGTTEDVSDIVSQGAMRDNFLIEDNLTARDAMVIIDRHGRLTCRDFNYSNSAQQNVLMYVGGQAIAERAWVSATFRPPLVVDGALYDVVGAGYLTQSQYDTQLSARQGLGQKSDGTFVLLTVDGATDVSGTTVKKQAEKMLALGCVDAFALDTGGSVTLWYDGAVINTPSDVGGEREVPAVMYV